MYMYSIFGQIYITHEPSYRSCNFFTEEIGVRHEDEKTNPPMNVILAAFFSPMWKTLPQKD